MCYFRTIKAALEMAEKISGFSPLAVQGTKYYLLYAREHTVQDGLDAMVSV